MKFTFDKDALLKEITIAQEIIATRNALSILSNVFFCAKDNSLIIKATDIKMNFETKIPVTIEEEGTTTIFCDKFINILNSLPSGEVEFAQEGIKVIIRPLVKKIKFQLKSMASDNFPEFSTDENLDYFEISAKDFKEMLSQTILAVSDDETRYFMNGVFFEKNGEKLVLVATDGRRLAYIEKPLYQDINFSSAIVPPKILNIILHRASNEGNISLAIVDKMIYFKFGNYQFSSVLIDGQFPNYQRVIPEQQKYVFEINKEDLANALKRVGLLVEQKSRRIFFELTPGALTIYSQETDIGVAREEIPCKYDGESINIAMNYLYVDEPIKVIETERISFEFTELMKAITMRPEPAKDYFHIIMPMQTE